MRRKSVKDSKRKNDMEMPRKTLISKRNLWTLRNDSSTMCQLLGTDCSSDFAINSSCDAHPASLNACEVSTADAGLEAPRKCILFSKSCKSKGKREKYFKSHCPECYCKRFPIEPLLFAAAPNTSSCSCCNRPLLEQYFDKRNFSAAAQNEEFTQRRKRYEDLCKDYFVTHLSKERLIREEQQQPQRESFQEVEEFRSEHFFECHSTADILPTENLSPDNAFNDFNGGGGGEDGQHICVHRMQLQDDLKLDPLEPDAYGQSRCTICAKSLSSLLSSHLARRDKKAAATATAAAEEEQPKCTLNVPLMGGRCLFNVRVPECEKERLGFASKPWHKDKTHFRKTKTGIVRCASHFSSARPQNSLALSHQKGIV